MSSPGKGGNEADRVLRQRNRDQGARLPGARPHRVAVEPAGVVDEVAQREPRSTTGTGEFDADGLADDRPVSIGADEKVDRQVRKRADVTFAGHKDAAIVLLMGAGHPDTAMNAYSDPARTVFKQTFQA